MSISLSGLTAYLQSALLNHLFGSPAYDQPMNLAIGLFSTLPGADGTGGAELAGGGYARQAFRSFNAASGSPPTVANNVAIQWPAATANWLDTVGVGVFDASTSGNLLAFGNLVSPGDGVTPVTQPIATGDVMRIGTGNLVIGFSAAGAGGLTVLRAVSDALAEAI